MPILANTNAFCVAPRTSAKLMREWGVVDDRLREVQPGDAVEVGDVRISVHGAADPGEPGAVTYILVGWHDLLSRATPRAARRSPRWVRAGPTTLSSRSAAPGT